MKVFPAIVILSNTVSYPFFMIALDETPFPTSSTIKTPCVFELIVEKVKSFTVLTIAG